MITNSPLVLEQTQRNKSSSKIFYITCHLKRAIHAGISRNLKRAFLRKMRTASLEQNDELRNRSQFGLRKRYLHKIETLLHSRQAGPHFLKDERLSSILEKQIFELDGLHYNLLSFSIMPNHFHLLIEAEVDGCHMLENTCSAGEHSHLRKIINLIVEGTTKPMTLELKRVGPVWEDTFYGLEIKDKMTLEKVTKYILEDPNRPYIPNIPAEYDFSYKKKISQEEKVTVSAS